MMIRCLGAMEKSFVDIRVLVFLLQGTISTYMSDGSLNSSKSEEHLRKSVTDLFSKVLLAIIPTIFDLFVRINRSGERF